VGSRRAVAGVTYRCTRDGEGSTVARNLAGVGGGARAEIDASRALRSRSGSLRDAPAGALLTRRPHPGVGHLRVEAPRRSTRRTGAPPTVPRSRKWLSTRTTTTLA
jgi:hypothetical protein